MNGCLLGTCCAPKLGKTDMYLPCGFCQSGKRQNLVPMRFWTTPTHQAHWIALIPDLETMSSRRRSSWPRNPDMHSCCMQIKVWPLWKRRSFSWITSTRCLFPNLASKMPRWSNWHLFHFATWNPVQCTSISTCIQTWLWTENWRTSLWLTNPRHKRVKCATISSRSSATSSSTNTCNICIVCKLQFTTRALTRWRLYTHLKWIAAASTSSWKRLNKSLKKIVQTQLSH